MDIIATDASDAQTPTDVQPDVAPDVAQDVATDAPGDGGTGDGGGMCTATYDFWSFLNNSVQVGLLDGTLIGEPDMGVLGFADMRAVAPDPPQQMMGHCGRTSLGIFGGMGRAMSAGLNLGTITATQGTNIVSFPFDMAMNGYGVDTSMATTFVPGMPITFQIPGAPGGMAATYTLPMVRRIGVGDVTLPTSISRTAPTTITFPAGDPSLGANEVAIFYAVDNAESNFVVCGVPACAGSITIPNELVTTWAANTMVFMNFQIMRRTPSTTPGTTYEVWTSSAVLGNSLVP